MHDMTYPQLLKRKDDYMKTEDVLMMTPIQDDLVVIVAELTQENKRLNEIIASQNNRIEALLIDNHFTSGKHHGQN